MLDERATFGPRLRERREELGWNVETLAYHAGMTAQQVRNIEAGRTKRPHQATIQVIQQALDLGGRRRAARLKVRAE